MILTFEQLADLAVMMKTRQFTKVSILDSISLYGHPADPEARFEIKWYKDDKRWFFCKGVTVAAWKNFMRQQ